MTDSDDELEIFDDQLPLSSVRPPTPTVSSDELLRADSFTRYLAEIRGYNLLTREEEELYAKAFQARRDVEAGKRLVTGNLRLVVKIALEYRRAWVNIMDLIQEGNIGLAEAVRRYDPYRGVRFSSFARYWIKALILQFILKNFRLVSFANTRAGRKLFFRLEKERHRLMQLTGEATPRQLAANLEVSEDDIVLATQMRQNALSLQAPAGGEEGGRPLGDAISDESVNVESSIVRDELMATVDVQMKAFAETLSDDRERAIWFERMVAEEPAALAELGDRFNVSRERIRQVEARMKERLKAFLTERLGESIILDFTSE